MKRTSIALAIIGALILVAGLIGFGPGRDTDNARTIAGAVLVAGGVVAAAVMRSSPASHNPDETKTQR